MEIQLQELIEQIKKDGVEAAESQAEAILTAAKDEAEKRISILIKDSDGNILNSSYYKHTFPKLQADCFTVSMPSRGDAATVQVYISDSTESELIISDVREWGIWLQNNI